MTMEKMDFSPEFVEPSITDLGRLEAVTNLGGDGAVDALDNLELVLSGP
jgi:hypothetical protein